MKFYIGLGGIGTRALQHYAEIHQLPDEVCFYLDADRITGSMLSSRQFYLIPGLETGTGSFRNIGRSAVLKEIFCGRLRDFFAPVFRAERVSLIFLTSSFGGFGGAAATVVMDYLEANTWGKQENICELYALSENYMRSKGFPQILLDKYESNTISFVRSVMDRADPVQPCDIIGNQSRLFIPQCRLHLIDGSGYSSENEFAEAMDLPEEQVRVIDWEEQYVNINRRTDTIHQVFVSFSSEDREAAKLFVSILEKNGIRCWISDRDMRSGAYASQIVEAIRKASVFLVILTENSIRSEHVKNEIDLAFERLRDGLRMIPFSLTDVELDDDCKYYLRRQQIFSGKKPPLVERIEEVVKLIKEKL